MNENMKENYEKMELEVIVFDSKDVIVTSILDPNEITPLP